MKGESSPLLPVAADVNGSSSCCKKSSSFCIQSRPARWILLWSFAVLMTYRLLYSLEILGQLSLISLGPIMANVGFIVISIVSPVAGLLTDVKWSRYRAVLYSSRVIIVILLVLSLLLIMFILLMKYKVTTIDKKLRNVLISVYSGVFLFSVVYIIFLINAFQFGIDQLHDASTLDLVSYIHWYVWIYHTSSLLSYLSLNLWVYDNNNFNGFEMVNITGISAISATMVVSVVLLIVSLCVFRCKKAEFLLQPAGVNPYKLVYKVTHFAHLHKFPLRRSAFTFCTEESPSRMDVGKSKFGGPFTNKQVEDVKAFWGISKVLLSVGPAFLLQTVTQAILPLFARHGNLFIRNYTLLLHNNVHLEGGARYILISNGVLTPATVVVCIPLYLWCIRPYIKYYTLTTLKRMGLAMALMVFSLLCTFVMDFVVHFMKIEDANCMFRIFGSWNFNYATEIIPDSLTEDPLYQNVYFFTLQNLLSALVNMLLDVAVYEFICAQSPYSMKGLLLGICFSTRSLFQGLAIISMVPFGHWRVSVLSCGSGFYLMNIVIGLCALVVFCCVSRKYKRRQMDEPSHEYRYAEAYYSNIQ